VHYSALGGAYDDGVWLGQAEVSYIHTNTPLYPSQISGYLSLGRRINKFTFYALGGFAKAINNNINIPPPTFVNAEIANGERVANLALKHSGVDEKSFSLGVRWDFRANMALKTQWSHVWLGQSVDNWWQPDAGINSATVNVWSVGIDFIF